ncbi:protein-tyrosine phosphatase family protein [soil metagenome]
MPQIAVCSLAAVPEEIARRGPSHLITLLSPGSLPDRPEGVAHERMLRLEVNDIDEEIEGLRAPCAATVDDILSFAKGWDGESPILIHCWAGISRSTAAAFVVACARNPEASEAKIATALRRASPTASPNRRIVALADAKMGRDGRMVAAVAAMGEADFAEAATPFHIPARF